MPDNTSTPEGFSLKRWSRRKLEAAQAASDSTAPAPVVAVPVDAAAPPSVVAAPAPHLVDQAPPLPPVESLTHDSDFSAFMQPKVDEAIKRAALKKLFTDPRFNVMDGLDIYVGDYTQPDPMPDGMLDRLGKVYAAVTRDEDAVVPTTAAAALPEPQSADVSPLEEVKADTAPAEAAPEDAADAVAVHVPSTDAASTGPAALQDATVRNPPLAHPRGKLL